MDRSELITFREIQPGLIANHAKILTMTKSAAESVEGGSAPTSYPTRNDLLRTMLAATGRGGVPLRRAFVQSTELDADGTRRGPLAALISDPSTLDAYLLIHALASARTPYGARYQSAAWAIMAGYTAYSEMTGAKSRWSRSVTKLAQLGLIRREGSGRSVRYFLLHESGDGTAYTRPKTKDDDRWFTVPYSYWLDGWDEKLSAAEKFMLLIALSSKPNFELPYNRVPTWYGISESTAKRGLTKLADREKPVLLRYQRWVPDAASKTLWRTVTSYRLLGVWSGKSRAAVMRKERPERSVHFDDGAESAMADGTPPAQSSKAAHATQPTLEKRLAKMGLS